MRSTFCFKTENGNYYLFDKKARIYSSISKEQFQVFQSLEGHTGTHSPEPEALDDHYVKKYHWLKENGFFMDMESKNRFHGELKVEDLKYHLANLKQLVFEVTDKCNLNCTYCAYGHLYTNYDTRLNRDLSFEEGKEVIDYILSYDKSEFNNLSGIPLTVSFYGGEPLMNFAFVKKMV